MAVFVIRSIFVKMIRFVFRKVVKEQIVGVTRFRGVRGKEKVEVRGNV